MKKLLALLLGLTLAQCCPAQAPLTAPVTYTLSTGTIATPSLLGSNFSIIAGTLSFSGGGGGGGTVQSVTFSPGTTGLTGTFANPTTTPSMTLGGVLNLANGGTGTSSSLTGLIVGNGASGFGATTSLPFTFLTGSASIAQAGTGTSSGLTGFLFANGGAYSATTSIPSGSLSGVFTLAGPNTATGTNSFTGINTFSGTVTLPPFYTTSYNALLYGAAGCYQITTTGTSSSGSTALALASTTSWAVGEGILLRGAGGVQRSVSDGVTQSGSSTISSATAHFRQDDVLKVITGAGIPANTVISTVSISGYVGTAALSATATQSATGLTVVLGTTTSSRTVTDGVTTSGSATISSATLNFRFADMGQPISIAGFPAVTTTVATVSINNFSSTAQISNPATATASGVTLNLLANETTTVSALGTGTVSLGQSTSGAIAGAAVFHDDTLAINNALIVAATTTGGKVYLPAFGTFGGLGIYGVNGPFNATTSGIISLPQVGTNVSSFPPLVGIEGEVEGFMTLQTNSVASGVAIVSDQYPVATSTADSLISALTSTTTSFNGVNFYANNVIFVTAPNPTISIVNMHNASQAYIDDQTGVFAETIGGTPVQPTTSTSFGVLMPQPGNQGDVYLGNTPIQNVFNGANLTSDEYVNGTGVQYVVNAFVIPAQSFAAGMVRGWLGGQFFQNGIVDQETTGGSNSTVDLTLSWFHGTATTSWWDQVGYDIVDGPDQFTGGYITGQVRTAIENQEQSPGNNWLVFNGQYLGLTNLTSGGTSVFVLEPNLTLTQGLNTKTLSSTGTATLDGGILVAGVGMVTVSNSPAYFFDSGAASGSKASEFIQNGGHLAIRAVTDTLSGTILTMLDMQNSTGQVTIPNILYVENEFAFSSNGGANNITLDTGGSGTITLSPNGNLTLTLTGSSTLSGNLIGNFVGGSTLTVTGATTITGGGGAAIQMAGEVLTLSGSLTVAGGNPTLTGSGTIALASGTATLSPGQEIITVTQGAGITATQGTGTLAGTVTIATAIAGISTVTTANGLVATLSAPTLTLSLPNIGSGSESLSGSLTIGTTLFATGASTLTAITGSTLSLSGVLTATNAEVLTGSLAATSVTDSGGFSATSGSFSSLTNSGATTLTGAATLVSTVTLSGLPTATATSLLGLDTNNRAVPITLTAGTNITLAQSNNTLTISASGGGGSTTVTNSDGTITVAGSGSSPTTVSVALSHANTWTGAQTVSLSGAGPALTLSSSGTALSATGAISSSSSITGTSLNIGSGAITNLGSGSTKLSSNGSFTLTVPASETSAGLDVAQTFTQSATFSSGVTFSSNTMVTGAAGSFFNLGNGVNMMATTTGSIGMYANSLNVPISLNFGFGSQIRTITSGTLIWNKWDGWDFAGGQSVGVNNGASTIANEFRDGLTATASGTTNRYVLGIGAASQATFSSVNTTTASNAYLFYLGLAPGNGTGFTATNTYSLGVAGASNLLGGVTLGANGTPFTTYQSGTATLASGTVTVTVSGVTSSTKYQFQRTGVNSSSALGEITVLVKGTGTFSAQSNGVTTGTILSTDNSVFDWQAISP